MNLFSERLYRYRAGVFSKAHRRRMESYWNNSLYFCRFTFWRKQSSLV